MTAKPSRRADGETDEPQAPTEFFSFGSYTVLPIVVKKIVRRRCGGRCGRVGGRVCGLDRGLC